MLAERSPSRSTRPEAIQIPGPFQSLVDRSIAAWHTINYRRSEEERLAVINDKARLLRSFQSLEDLFRRRDYWFFQLRESFMRQKALLKWDPSRLDEYILLPISYGFINNQDCFFSLLLTREHPDPKATDLVQIQQDLKNEKWTYVWVDWTCMPQLPRTELEQEYFNRMLQYIHMLVRDCAYEWRFPAFEPRGWIIFEVAEYVLNHKNFIWTDDNRPFINHIIQMTRDGVRPVMEKYGYRCARQGDVNLVIGWLELSIILFKILPDDVDVRQEIRDWIDAPHTGGFDIIAPGPEILGNGLSIDKVNGIISYQGKTYRFTPVYQLTSHA
ncbi:LOW QUALITY PROTEIN: hypothetical protein CVT26_002409 [Gymnopilus dilepis]|uniref:Uncharacterized protein n=1 Tax=Gymnopilus dilepis TaxID=231916 RepID=A0A409YN82_9AGAR|nr:LOW QUALITY PROTEIN: hypothetical protein CVT26_002409 [Gymnopilus dilepis]